LTLGLLLAAAEPGGTLDAAVSRNAGLTADPVAGPPPASDEGAVPPADVLKSVPITDKDAAHLVPAMAITLRYLFNTMAIAGFVLIVLLAAMWLLRLKVQTAREKQQAEQRQRQLAEANLSRQRAHLLTILKSLLDIYILVDEAGGCHAIVNNQNDPWWPNEALAEMTVEDLFPADLVPVVRKTISRTLREGLSQTIEFRKTVDGQEGWFESRTAPLQAHEDDPARVIWIVRNISARMSAINNVRALSTRLSLVEEKERRTIAADLHDTIGQNLAIARMKLGVLGRKMEDDEAGQIIKDLVRDNEESIRVIRETINELSPPALHRLGLDAALEALAERFTREHGIPFRVKSGVRSLPAYERELKVIAFRVVRELMFNIVKHSQARSATITLTHRRKGLTIEVADDGIGFDMAESRVLEGKALNLQSDRFGLLNVREAVTYLGGEFAVRSEKSVGTHVKVWIPVKSGAAREVEDKRP
jgi:PAS domain S-box-containing protein